MLSKCIILSCMMWLHFPSSVSAVSPLDIVLSFLFSRWFGSMHSLFHTQSSNKILRYSNLYRIPRMCLWCCLRPCLLLYFSSNSLSLSLSRSLVYSFADGKIQHQYFFGTRKSCFEIRYEKLYSLPLTGWCDMDIHFLELKWYTKFMCIRCVWRKNIFFFLFFLLEKATHTEEKENAKFFCFKWNEEVEELVWRKRNQLIKDQYRTNERTGGNNAK